MQKIKVEDITEGMFLVQPVTDAMGRVLIPKGQKIPIKLVGKLKLWGVDWVYVEGEVEDELFEGEEVSKSPEDIKFELAKIEEDLNHMFGRIKDNTYMEAIKLLAKRTLANKILGG